MDATNVCLSSLPHHSVHKCNYIHFVCFHIAILISHWSSTIFSTFLPPWQFFPFPLPIYLLQISIKCILCLSYTIIKVPLSFSFHHPPLSVFKFRFSFTFTCLKTVQHLHFPAFFVSSVSLLKSPANFCTLSTKHPPLKDRNVARAVGCRPLTT